MRASNVAIMISAALLTGCVVGPKYRRPEVAVPETFRTPSPQQEVQVASLADLNWFDVFHDEKLQELIRGALVQNYDLRDAVTRVEQARANLGTTRSNQIPQVDASNSLNVTRTSRMGQSPCRSRFPSLRTATMGRQGSICSRSKSISGDAYDARPRRRARTS